MWSEEESRKYVLYEDPEFVKAGERLKEDERFPHIPISDMDGKSEWLLIQQVMTRVSGTLGLAPGTQLDLVACNDYGSFGREAWAQVVANLLEPQPAPHEPLYGSSVLYLTRYEVPRRGQA